MLVSLSPGWKVGNILLEGMTALTAAPEWNAAPPVSYLDILVFSK
jgi:hypothetical protein